MNMIYTHLTNQALKIVYTAHHGQVDKGGIPYVFHPYQVAQAMTDEYSTCVALLHDVVEDTNVTLQDLQKIFPDQITEAIAALTHTKGEDYMVYLARVKANPIAKAVKLADIEHNANATRMPDANPETKAYFQKKYADALAFLNA